MNRQNQKAGSGRISQGLIYLLIIAAVVLSLTAEAVAQDDRSFYFPAVIIEAEVRPDGSVPGCLVLYLSEVQQHGSGCNGQ